MIQTLYNRLVDLRASCQKEWLAREQTKSSEPYQDLEAQIRSFNDEIELLKMKQSAILESIPDSKPFLEEAKNDLFEAMRLEGKETFGDAKIKFSHKSDVNKARLLVALDGDLDLFVTLSNVTQTALKDYVKTSGQKSLLSCIDTVSTPVGVAFES